MFVGYDCNNNINNVPNYFPSSEYVFLFAISSELGACERILLLLVNTHVYLFFSVASVAEKKSI